ncbi:helix-turn-helix domain-containing protein [Mycolicibacterium rutilum]|uniref:helix-turn-helix domain-containing protein n=1 Tax=Mycolicibacterium rutilum TaxID=370526 RepID=UPI000B155D1B|nr:helix-turn-helix domain-containing protein [Mycolicibacterium rutilum]
MADGASRVGDIAALTGLSHRRFTDVFSAGVGMTPKRFARLRRFRRALDCIGAARGWAEFAAAHGFSDQAHMIREFQAFSGLTPVEHVVGRSHPAKDDHIALVS